MIGTKIYKSDMTNYFTVAEWCNNNNATIEDMGDYFEVVDITPSLDELKQSKLLELKAERNRKEVEPITYAGNLYDYDEKARDRINAAIIALDLQGEKAAIEWTLADNSNITVTANDLRAVICTVAVRSNALHVAYRNAKDKVNAATNKLEIDKICLF